MLWLSLLGLATFLTIALRRVRRRQKPLSDELYAKNVAIDHVFSGVAWVRADNRIAYVNPALSRLLQLPVEEIVRRDWRDLFALGERGRVEQAYSQMLLMGKAELDTATLGRHGEAQCNVLLVAVHDHRMRFVGHHCIVQHTREQELQERLRELTAKAHIPQGQGELHLVS